jgi:phage shock protein PspC (stress-responsive transcriptional regulator)
LESEIGTGTGIQVHFDISLQIVKVWHVLSGCSIVVFVVEALEVPVS